MPVSFLITLLLHFFPAGQEPPKFDIQVMDDKIEIGYGLAIGDVNGDKKPDILLADKKQFVWYRNGDWKRFVMVDNLTTSDNVCIAARDIDGDGRVEVAVGAQWNPGETSDTLASGSVHYLIRPEDPTQRWTPVELYHEPTIHRMRWVRIGKENYRLVVVPLHGRGNKGGEGQGVRVIAYERPADPKGAWHRQTIDESMHLTHNLEIVGDGNREKIYIGGKEGIKILSYDGKRWAGEWFVQGHSFGEVRMGSLAPRQKFLTGIEPMHGTSLTTYTTDGAHSRKVIATDLNQGHALASGDLLRMGMDQIVVGWREPNGDQKVGIKIFVPEDGTGARWKDYWVDENGMACEDLRLADLDGDGRPDIIAAGRASHNLKVYWNKSR